MAIVTESIRVVVAGANPQTKTFNINVDTTTGAGTGLAYDPTHRRERWN